MKNPDDTSLTNAYSILLMFETDFKVTYIGGIEKIQKVYPTQKKEIRPWIESEYVPLPVPKSNVDFAKEIRPQENIFNTSGSNLKEVLKINKVDATRTYSNDIQEIISVLGIEAGRRSIIN